MISTQINNIVNQLKNYSASLEKSNILIDKPWTIIDDDNEIQRLIFKKDKTLILSKNGQAQIGKWDYFPEAKSLLIDRITDKILCNEAFIDEGVLILKLDGTNNKLFVLANQNIIPDLNVLEYLNNHRQIKLNFVFLKLTDGNRLEVEKMEYGPCKIGDRVFINQEQVEDGNFQEYDEKRIFEVKNSKIFNIIYVKTYETPEGIEVTIHQKIYWDISKGDTVYINSKIIENQLLKLKNGEKILIQEGKIVSVKKSFLRTLFG